MKEIMWKSSCSTGLQIIGSKHDFGWEP